MLQSDADLLKTNVQLNLLHFRKKFIAKLHVAGRSADQLNGLFCQYDHFSRKQYAPQFAGQLDDPQLNPLRTYLDVTKSSASYEHQLRIIAINLQISATTDVLQ